MRGKVAGRKKKGLTAIIVVAAATLVAGIVILAWLSGSPVEKDTRQIQVYFSDEEGLLLKSEARGIKTGPADLEATGAIEALIEGPENRALASPLPPGTRLLALRIEGRVAVVDLSPEVVEKHAGGSSGELQTVYSIVNTLTLNFPEIREVQILVGGRKTPTIAGHIDITMPLGPDRKMIKG